MPFKICSLDCIYCQLGRTLEKTIQRKVYIPAEPVLSELKDRLTKGLTADFITISGSGEPTLNSQLGGIINDIKKITNIPIAVLTNGTLFYLQDVRDDCCRADVVLPSLDAADQQTFKKINRPHPDISIENVISGLCKFRNQFHGQIWLEVFLVDGINTDSRQIDEITDAIKRIRPDKVHLNTAVRPTAEPNVKAPSQEKLHKIAKQLGKNCQIVTDFSTSRCADFLENNEEHLLSMLKRRPCSINDICSALTLTPTEAVKYIARLQKKDLVHPTEKNGITFYSAD